MGHFTRRDFTRNAAIVALCAPFLSLLEPTRSARGQEKKKAKYLLIFFTNGTDTAVWSPKGSNESSITFSQMTEPLSAIKDQITIVEKLNSNNTAAGHASPGGLCGSNWGATPLLSIDQFVSDGLKANGIRTQIANLVLGGTTEAQQQTTFFRANTGLTPIYSPVAAYQAIFGNLTTGSPPPMMPGGTPTSPPPDQTGAAEARLKRRLSVLDAVTGELTALEKSLGGIEKQKLQLHLDSIRQLEERLQPTTSGGAGAGSGGGSSTGGGPIPVAANCTSPGQATAGDQAFTNSVLHLDLAVNAFACDLTRVASVQFGHHQQCAIKIPGVTADYHNDLMHSDPAPHARLATVERWLAQQFVDVVNKLKARPAPDGQGTLLDQTIICWARDMGDAPNHTGDDMRFVFAGGAGGYLKKSPNGRYLNGGGESHQRALISLADAMGITDVAGFGDKSQSHTPLANLST